MAQKYSEAQKQSAKKWDAANLDRLSIALPKGHRDTIKAHAEARSESVNGFIKRAIQEAIERDNGTVPTEVNELKIKMSPGNQEVVCGYAEVHGESVDDFVFRAISETMKRDIAEMKAKTSQTDPEAEPATE